MFVSGILRILACVCNYFFLIYLDLFKQAKIRYPHGPKINTPIENVIYVFFSALSAKILTLGIVGFSSYFFTVSEK